MVVDVERVDERDEIVCRTVGRGGVRDIRHVVAGCLGIVLEVLEPAVECNDGVGGARTDISKVSVCSYGKIVADCDGTPYLSE